MEAAAALVQPWQVAVGVAAGVIVSYLTVIACVLAVRRFGSGLLTAIPRGRRMRVVVPTLVGSVAVGGPLWVLWVGPLILP